MICKLLKPIIICVTLLTFAVSLFAQNPFSPYKEIKPQGKIDSVIIRNARGKHVYIYNKNRQLIEDTRYQDEFFPHAGIHRLDTMKTQFTYGANNRLISSLRIYQGTKRPASYQYFNRNYGYAIRTTEPGDVDTLVYEMHFNHAGQMIRSGYYAPNNWKFQHPGNIDYKYNKEGNMIERIIYTHRPEPNRMFYKYDSNRDEVENIRPAGGDYSKKTTYKYSNYDKMHNWTQRADDFINAFEEDDSIHHEDTIRRRIVYHK